MAARKTHRSIPAPVYRRRMAALSYWLVYECGLTQQEAAETLGYRSQSTINRHLKRYWSYA